MAGRKSKYKGRRAEQEIVCLLKKSGVPAKRISMLETAHTDKGDIEVAGIWKAEVKCGSHVPKWVYKVRKTKDIELAFFKRDRKDWLVMMDLEWFLKTFI